MLPRAQAYLRALTLAWLVATPLAAAEKPPLSDDAQYRACLKLTATAPEEAFESGLAWADRGGGSPARHCVALALVQLKDYGGAADRLEKLAEALQREGSPLLAEVLGQAGNAWLLAGLPQRAYAAFTSALRVAPDDVDLLIDRARALAATDDWAAAAQDLGQALSLDPRRDEAYSFRASARRHLGDAAGALEDVETALAIDAELPEALLERGILRRAAGDTAGARRDWAKVRELAPNTPVGDAAAYNLQEIDIIRR
jgi:tetratricopeptide (TPR) repeat protein